MRRAHRSVNIECIHLVYRICIQGIAVFVTIILLQQAASARNRLCCIMPTEEQLWSAFECIDEYLGAQEELAKALKDGLFNIARGKYTLGAALGQQRYPGDMQATSLVHICPSTSNEDMYDEFRLQQNNPVQTTPASTACDTAAGSSRSSTMEDSATPAAAVKHDHKQDLHSNSLHWFTALPPQPVRQAQMDFNTALQRAVAAVNAAQRLRQLAADLSLVDETDDADADKAVALTGNN